jgi:hypothetical protein
MTDAPVALDLLRRQVAATTWTVYTSWRASVVVPAAETSETHPDWPTARRQALNFACCNGVRYVSVQDPDDVVVGEYDRYTNRWREYHLT